MQKFFSFLLPLALVMGLVLTGDLSAQAASSAELFQEIGAYDQDDTSTKVAGKIDIKAKIETDEVSGNGKLSINALQDIENKLLQEKGKFSLSGIVNGKKISAKGTVELRVIQEKAFALIQSLQYTTKERNPEADLVLSSVLGKWLHLKGMNTQEIWDNKTSSEEMMAVLIAGFKDGFISAGGSQKIADALVNAMQTGEMFLVEKSPESNGKVVYTISLNKDVFIKIMNDENLSKKDILRTKRLLKGVNPTVKITVNTEKKVTEKVSLLWSVKDIKDLGIKEMTVNIDITVKPVKSVVVEAPKDYIELPPQE
ncbi:MAG: hypothetical protein WCJ84_05645 [Candidatus Peregrinibacteria bacterium]